MGPYMLPIGCLHQPRNGWLLFLPSW